VSNVTRTNTVRLFLMMVSLSLCTMAFGGTVDLMVVGTYPDARLEIEDNDVKCGNDKSCIKTNKGSELDVDFRLKQACNEDGPQYKLTAMQFSMVESEPDGSGGTIKPFGKYPMPSSAISDFDLRSDGYVIWDGANNNKLADDKIKLKDKNETAYTIYFMIEAAHCANSSEVIYLDPRIENTGR
jgi:hypothetical protein